MKKSFLTLNNFLENALSRHGEKTALHFGTKKITYKELHAEANRVAHALIKNGVKRNTRVALLMSNRKEYVVSELAIFFAGGTKVPLNNMLKEQDIHYILKDSDAEILIVEEACFNTVKNIQAKLPKLKTIVGINAKDSIPNDFISWETFQNNQPETNPKIVSNPDDLSLILYTGGTTGDPKGVVHSHETTILTFMSIIVDASIQEDEKILLMTPLPHAANLYLYAGLIKGAEIFIESKFDTKSAIKHIETNKITFISLVPTILYRMIDFMEGKEIDVSSVRTIQYGTSPITMERLKQALNIFGQVFIQIYGLTETQGAVTWLKKDEHQLEGNLNILKSCGKPAVFSQVKVVDQNGKEVPAGVEGEIAVKSLLNMIGYHKSPEKTEETKKDGWLLTGDIGMMDEKGYLYLLDRNKDMIISGGMNVYSSEVENVIQQHTDVRQVAVIGVPDEDWGEAV